MKYDFAGWATKNDLRCGDGLTIRKDAFKSCDGMKVPLVWNHQHQSPSGVLGHAILENRDEGVYAYCSFNNTQNAKDAKEYVKHGDITSLSIWANNLEKNGRDILHGVIREVSLVLAGANPGAFIESVLSHGESMDEDEDEGIFYTGCDIYLAHADENGRTSKEEEEDMEGKTVKEIIDTMTDEQKQAMAVVVGQAIEDARGGSDEDDKDYDEEGDEEEVRHSIFDQDQEHGGGSFISHSDMTEIIESAKRCGSFKEALHEFLGEDGQLIHSLDTTGMDVATGKQTYGFNDPNMLFPDYKSLSPQPDWISRNMDWVTKVMNTVGRTPFSRIKTVHADITEDEARAKGYIKGKQKKEEVFTLLKRKTDPQTVYKKQKLDRDDIIDITEFDVVAWIRAEMRVMLDEEIARAILIGDGRPADSDDKIQEAHVRPVVSDVPLYNVTVEVTTGSTDAQTAKNTIDAVIRSRKKYKGSGSPSFYTTEDVITEMLLLEDTNGHKLYKTEQELATTLRVSEIVPVEPMEGHKVNGKNLIGTIVNLKDYKIGADKGGEINNFEDFDIDFNQMKYLIETRFSGALVKPFSAITLLESSSVTPPSSVMTGRSSY